MKNCVTQYTEETVNETLLTIVTQYMSRGGSR